ncbi:Mss4-like protein [Crucibulum laeve]|uniref:Mss4-like protein n=1 Tax=Crucibulum laeve TaxID=68775 RepID=A0A5C3LJD2_9AGAR|nr:Mss4-like protein [Crucibulum laeve]
MTTYVRAKCHCQQNVFKIPFRTDSLPIPNNLCHCNACRHSTGQLAGYHVRFEGMPLSITTEADEPADLENLTKYQTSIKAARYFCSTCSAHMFWQSIGDAGKDRQYWEVAVGLLEQVDGIVKVKGHIYVGETLDGGMADHFISAGDKVLARYAQGEGGEQLPVGWRAVLKKASKEGQQSEEWIQAYCHCRTVSFIITRPNSQSSIPSCPYPDLLVPGTEENTAKAQNPTDRKWWLRPTGASKPKKYLAGYCACASCRLTSGAEVLAWVFMPRANIIDTKTNEPIQLEDENHRPKGLKQYISSHGRYREFCSTCGAIAFRWKIDRTGLLDVAAGLFDQEQGGARADGWFDWIRDRIGFSEDAIGNETIIGLIEVITK